MRRLGKQRVECIQILHTLLGISSGWRNHPAVRMWRGYELALSAYGLVVIKEWTNRGYKDTCRDKILNLELPEGVKSSYDYPPWLGSLKFHRSHRSNLIRKDPDWYGKYSWDVPDDLPYVWPV